MTTQQINLINKAAQKFNLETQLSQFNSNALYLTLNRSLVGEVELDSETIYPLYNGDNQLLMSTDTIAEIKQTLKDLRQAEKVEQKQQLKSQLILEWESMKSTFKREELADDCDNSGIDIRLQKVDDEILLHIGDSQYDSNHYGIWACGTLDFDWQKEELEANINDLVECLLYELENN